MANLNYLASRYGVAKAQDQNENLGRLAEMLGSARDIGNEYKSTKLGTVSRWHRRR